MRMQKQQFKHLYSTGVYSFGEHCWGSMTSNNFEVETISTVLAALLAIPLVIMGVLMPLMVLVKGGKMMGAVGSLGMIMPIIPLAILSVLAYSLYTYSGSDEERQKSGSSLEELRSAYARGDLSDEEFENRRDRLQSQLNVADRGEVSNHE